MFQIQPTNFSVLERFLRYVKIDTQSDPHSNTFPSTEKQKDLGAILVDELIGMGVKDAYMDEFGYVFGTVPSNTIKIVPVVCFCAHMDTSPDCSGKDVKPLVHRNYQGQDIILPDDNSQILNPQNHTDLAHQLGNDIVTASGNTLLGADNKAGIAEIMDAVQHLLNNPELKHGEIRVLFTPDEEIGKGVDKLDMKKLKADVGYTVDGETLGSIENETFSADGVTIQINGVSVHPGFGDSMKSAIKIAGEIINRLPKDRLSPETTAGSKNGFIHPVNVAGTVECVTLEFIVRDFDDGRLGEYESELEGIVKAVIANYDGASYSFKVKEQYRNMKHILSRHPEVTSIGIEAIERVGIKPILRSIRGGTDGSRLSFMGLPCPNIFAGEHAFHGKQEWVSVQDMQKTVLTIIAIAQIWEEKA